MNPPLYVNLPAHYKVKGRESEDLVLSLKKSLYGTTTAPKMFFDHISEGLDKQGFVPSQSDPCLFIHKKKQLMILSYVDDWICIGKRDEDIQELVEALKADGYLLTMEPDSDLFSFLGIDVKQDKSNGTIEMTQKGLIDKVIRYTGLTEASIKHTPAAIEPVGTDPDGDPFDEEWNYAACIGMLLYLSSNSRPDIQYAVHNCARFTHSPKKSHGVAAKRIVRYLLKTRDKGILFTPDTKEGLDSWVDSDFVGLYSCEDHQDPISVRSRTGFTLSLFGCPLLWQSKLQGETCLSTVAAEYVAFSMCMRELLPMRELVKEIASVMDLEMAKSEIRSTVFDDSTGCLSLVNVPKMSPRNKYLALKYHFFREALKNSKGAIVARYVSTHQQKADIFTKGLAREPFETIRELLMGW